MESTKNVDNNYSFKNKFNNIFGWKVKEGKAFPPDFEFPDCVWERIDFFAAEYENGLTFEGALRFTLAYDEKECKKDWSCGGASDWLPVTEDFKNWRDSIMDKSMELAVALIYGPAKEEEAEN